MKLETIHLLRYIIIAFMCYVPTVTISGWFEAFMAKCMGDTIPEKSGFLTFDPFVHFNPWGFCLMFVNIAGSGFAAFGNMVPLTPEVLTKRWRNLRAAGEFFAKPLIHICMMLIAFVIMIVGYKAVFNGIDHHVFMMQNPESSLHAAICTLLTFFFQQNFSLFIIFFFVGLYRYIIFIFFPGFESSSLLNSVLYLIFLVAGIIVLGVFLQEITQSFLFAIQSILI